MGYTPEQLYKDPMLWRNSIHPDDQDRVQQLTRENNLFCIEYRVRGAEGDWLWFYDCAFAIRVDEGDTVIDGIALDITERKLAEENAVNSKLLLQRIIDLLTTRIFWKDNDLRYIGCNEVFAKDAGLNSVADIIGKDDFEMGWHEQAESYRADDFGVINSGEGKRNFEEPQTTPDGTKIWLRTSKVPLTDSAGNAIGVLGSYEDITEQKNHETLIKDKLHEIEKMNKFMMGRELRIIELKEEVKKLMENSGKS